MGQRQNSPTLSTRPPPVGELQQQLHHQLERNGAFDFGFSGAVGGWLGFTLLGAWKLPKSARGLMSKWFWPSAMPCWGRRSVGRKN
jgi:hypothetical protein